MKAMVLAAGEGRRMKPLTDVKPKPLLTVAGRPLIEHHIVSLRDAGITEIVVNVSYLGQQLIDFLEDGNRWGVELMVSEEASPLETAGGVVQALPPLGGSALSVGEWRYLYRLSFCQTAAGIGYGRGGASRVGAKSIAPP